jgi:hypothetical protein
MRRRAAALIDLRVVPYPGLCNKNPLIWLNHATDGALLDGTLAKTGLTETALDLVLIQRAAGEEVALP